MSNETNAKVVIIFKGGYIEEILCTDRNVKFTVCDNDGQGSTPAPYYDAVADKIIPLSEYENILEECDSDHLNAEDEQE